MRDCLILGSGRSGTSMLAGALHEAGYFLGERLHTPRDSNPKGFFEWYRINRINEQLLAPHDRAGLTASLGTLFGRHTVTGPGANQRWLALLPPGARVVCTDPALRKEIDEVVARRPFAYKDPRFCYTLPAWRPHLPAGTAFLCIFRDPATTVASILKECRSQPYLRSLWIGRRTAYKVWARMYRSVLEWHREDPSRFLFVHYDQVLDGSALPRLASDLDADLRQGFADPALRRSRPDGALPRPARELYLRLSGLAGYDIP